MSSSNVPAAPRKTPPLPTPGPEPVHVVLDAAGTIVSTTAAFDNLLELRSSALAGKSFASACAPTASVSLVEQVLRDATSGKIRTARVPVRVGNRKQLTFAMGFVPLRSARSRGLLATVRTWWSSEQSSPPSLGDMTYEISLRRFGTLRWACIAGDARADGELVGRRCFEALYGRDAPCEGCPLRVPAVGGRFVGVIKAQAPGASRAHVVSAQRVDTETALVSAVAVDTTMVTEILRAHINARAHEAGLTTREREVLDLLLLGRSTAQIAHALRISASTAKFHQANTLRKLEAESRVELLRQLL